MEKKHFVGLIIFICFACNTAWAQEPREQAEKFFSTIIGGQIDNAYDTIFAGAGFIELQPQQIQALKSQTKSAFSVYGTPFAFEIIHNENLCPSLRRMVYLLKFEKNPVTWEMYFYRAKDKWILAQILFVDQFQNISSKK